MFCAQELTEYMARKTGRAKGQRTRTYSHFVAGGEWIVLNKAQKRAMTEMLTSREPAVAVIADSGQKHLIFRARPGWWQFELLPPLVPDPETLLEILDATTPLYAAGASKSEIETGRWSQRTLRAVGITRLRALNVVLRLYRGAPLFQLAVFLTQKPEDVNGDDQLNLA